ncbi:hypothetical protein MYX78_02255 [Acidobacteria bacterium AH-259-G07]|nr:hypothetical protein [Acidobacteria bacterium AH-259-G07]
MGNLSAIAKREMAKEKAKLSGKRKRTPTALERAAERWELEEELKERQRRQEEQKKDSEETSFKTISPDYFPRATQSRSDVGFDWRQYTPGAAEGLQEEKPRYLNMATIRAMAKKMIAREWRRARGKPRRDVRLEQLDQAAASWYERKELERKKEEQKKQQLEGYVDKLNKALVEFSLRLEEETDESENDQFGEMFEEDLKWAGNPYKLEWSEKGCRIWYEPWEETQARKISKVADPVIYTAFIDEDMNIASLTKNEDDSFLPKVKEENLAANFEGLLKERSPEEGEIYGLLQETIAEVGRIVSFHRTSSGWVAAVEAWEEVRVRNIQKKGEEGASLSRIVIDETDGKFRFKIYRD